MSNAIPTDLLTTVGHVKHSSGVYIGRPMSRLRLAGSKYANPFKISEGCTREQAITKYREALMDQPALVMDAVRELSGKHLVCWCAPYPCHGDVLADICNRATAAALGVAPVGDLRKQVRQAPPTASTDVERTILATCESLEIDRDALLGSDSHPKYVLGREIVIYILRRSARMTLREVAQAMGKREGVPWTSKRDQAFRSRLACNGPLPCVRGKTAGEALHDVLGRLGVSEI